MPAPTPSAWSPTWAGPRPGSSSPASPATAPARSCSACSPSSTNRPAMLQMPPTLPKAEAGGGKGRSPCPAAHAKSPAGAGLSDHALQPASGGGGDRLDARGQAALVAGGLVPVDQAAGAEAVEQRLRGGEGLLRAGGVVGFKRLEHFLDGGAQLRTLAVVAQVAHDSLLGALLGRLDVGHNGILGAGVEAECGSSEQESMGESGAWVKHRACAERTA